MNRLRLVPHLLPLAALLALAPCLPARAAAQDAATATAAPKEVPLTAEQRAVFVGDYTITTQNGETMDFRIWDEDGALHAQPGDEEPARLIHLGDNVFTAEGHGDVRLTFVMEDGKATRFTAKRGDEDMGAGVKKP